MRWPRFDSSCKVALSICCSDVDRQPRVVAPARRVARGLRALLVVEHAHQRLHMALRLHVGAHDAVAHDGFAVFRQERRDDRVERPLAGRDLVRSRVQAEAVAAVLQADAESGLDAARTEPHVIALDEADHHAVLVGGGEIDRAALDRVAGAEVLRAFHVDQLGPAGQIAVVQHLLGRHAHAGRLGHIFVDIGKSQLDRFDLQVLRIGAVHRQLGDVEVLQDAQRDQRRDALAVGRDLMQRVAAIVLADRLDPFGLVGGEVARR